MGGVGPREAAGSVGEAIVATVVAA